MKSSRFAIIGAGVAVAAAGVITLLVVQGEPEEETTELASRTPVDIELAKRDVEGGSVKPWDAKPPTAQELKERAEADKAEAAEMLAEEKKAQEAEAHLARAQVIEQARAAGVLGTMQLKQGGAFASLTGADPNDDNIYGGLIGNEAGENGGFGFGRSGFGPGSGSGGGGTGWGTIGTGRYGTIGRGTGSGYGNRTVPSVSIGRPNATGDLDAAIIRRYIRRNIGKIQACYEKELAAKPKLTGTVASRFTIAATGNVVDASASGVDPTVAECVAGVIRGIEFPKPKNGGNVIVNYPFTFRPPSSP